MAKLKIQGPIPAHTYAYVHSMMFRSTGGGVRLSLYTRHGYGSGNWALEKLLSRNLDPDRPGFRSHLSEGFAIQRHKKKRKKKQKKKKNNKKTKKMKKSKTTGTRRRRSRTRIRTWTSTKTSSASSSRSGRSSISRNGRSLLAQRWDWEKPRFSSPCRSF